MTIKLESGVYTFELDSRLGRPGGFGEVFEGLDAGGNPVAVKRLLVDANTSAGRELRIAEVVRAKSFRHVMPVIDAGQDADSDRYYVIMPRATGDLQHQIETEGVLAPLQAASVLLQIAKGLKEVETIVHRDLKPGNVLFHEGNWKVADFGIARFVEEATSLNTLRGCLTPAYAAPEQYDGGRSTAATDIYALGGLGVFLLTGNPPFHGNQDTDRRVAVPIFDCEDSRLRGLIGMMLRVGPQSRPALKSVLERLERIILQGPAPELALSDLAKVGAEVADEQNRAIAREAEAKRANVERSLEGAAALIELRHIMERLYERIHGAAIAARFEYAQSEMNSGVIWLGKAELSVIGFTAGNPLSSQSFPLSGWDIIGHGHLKFAQTSPSLVWGASLWFGRTDVSADYRWYEVAYCSPLNRPPGGICMPRHAASLTEADEARVQASHKCCIAYGPYAIDGDMEDDFQRRMISLITLGAVGKLSPLTVNDLPFGRWPY